MLVSRVDGQRVFPQNVDVPSRVLDLLDLGVEIYGIDEAQKCFRWPLFADFFVLVSVCDGIMLVVGSGCRMFVWQDYFVPNTNLKNQYRRKSTLGINWVSKVSVTLFTPVIEMNCLTMCRYARM
jgi:hypothetical protein